MVFKSKFADIDPDEEVPPLPERLLDMAKMIGELDPGRIAFMDAHDHEHKLTFTQWHDSVHRVATFLLNAGFRKNEVATLVLPNCVEFPTIMFGAQRAGMVFSAANPAYTEYELGHQLLDSNASLVVTAERFLPKVLSAAKEKNLKMVICIRSLKNSPSSPLSKGVVDFRDVLKTTIDENALSTVKINLDNDIHSIMYSSGTTGKSKGVVVPHRAFAYMPLMGMKVREFFEEEAPDVMTRESSLLVFPTFHMAGILALTFHLFRARTQIMFARYNFEEFLAHIQEFKIKEVNAAPPILVAMASSPLIDKYDLSSLELLLCGAAPLSEGVRDKLLKRFPQASFQSGYGMTEILTAIFRYPGQGCLGYGGFVQPNCIAKIVKDGRECGVNEEGELRVKGPTVMKEYLNRPQETKDAFDEDGFLITGDLARIDEHGCVFITGRDKDLIKVKGFQVAPAELEDVISSLVGVAEAAVVGMRRGDFEAPWAFVVRKAATVTENTLKNLISSLLITFINLDF